jgi:hypothetical protein
MGGILHCVQNDKPAFFARSLIYYQITNGCGYIEKGFVLIAPCACRFWIFRQHLQFRKRSTTKENGAQDNGNNRRLTSSVTFYSARHINFPAIFGIYKDSVDDG